MNKYRVTVSLACTYVIEADNEDEAIIQAEEWFAECVPNSVVEIVNKEHCKFCDYSGDLPGDCRDCECFRPIQPDDYEEDIYT